MKMWMVVFWEDGSNQTQYEYYTNKDAADVRAKYLDRGWITARVVEKEILDKPREGAPEGYAYWNGVAVK